MISQPEEKTSLMIVRDAIIGSLSLALSDEHKVYELRIDMNQLSVPDKIWFHKQTSEVLYVDLAKETLAHNKSRTKISMLEAQLAQEKAQSKSWSTQFVVLQREIVMLREKISLPDKPLVKVKTFTRKKANTSDVDNALSQQVIQL